MIQALQLALQVMRHMASCEHPYHAKTLPGELDAAIKAVEDALAAQPEPIAWYHPMSGRVRWDGKNLPPSWLPLFPEPPKPKNDMSTEEKVRRFLNERKTPATAKAISDYYMVSKSAVQRALNDLERASKVTKTKKGGSFLWAWDRGLTAPVDRNLPNKALLDSVRSRPIQNSYPQVRGYDD